MRKLVALAVILASVPAAALAKEPAGLPVPDRLLAVKDTASGAALLRVDPHTLRALSRPLALGRHAGPWSFSPTGGRLAVAGGDPAEVRVVELGRWRTLGDVWLAPRGWIAELAWLDPRTLLAVVASPFTAVVAIDPVTRKVRWRRDLDGALVEAARSRDGVVVTLSGTEAIGPTTLATVDRTGVVRSAALGAISSGTVWSNPSDGSAPTGRGSYPGLAVDEEGQRAFVVGAGEPVAEVSLTTMAVSWHDLADRGLAARSKALEASYREVRWVDDGLLAVAGREQRSEEEQRTATGLQLVDTHDWSVRTVDPQAESVQAGSGSLLATVGSRIAVYGADGARRLTLPGGTVLGFAGRYAYVGRESSVAVVDLAAARAISVPVRGLIPLCDA